MYSLCRITDLSSSFYHSIILFSRLSTALQILIFLPLTLSTLSTSAFLLLSFLLFVHSLIYGSLTLLWPSPLLSVLEVPAHPILLLVCFNTFSQAVPSYVITAASWWGKLLQWSSPGFVVLEGISSLLIVQRLGQIGKSLVEVREGYQFGLLVAAAAAYVTSAWWIVAVSACLLAFIRDWTHGWCSRHIHQQHSHHYHPRCWV